MKEKIFDVIKNAEKALNPTEIMDVIKPDNTVSDYEELLECLRKLCQEGIIRLTSGNGYVINELLVGKMDMHAKGNGHVLVHGEEDILVNKINMNGALDKDTVLVDYTNKEHTEGRVVRVLKRSLGRGLGEVVNNNGVFSIKVLDELPYHVEIEKTDINLVDGLIVHLDYVRDLAKGRVLAKVDYTIGHKNAVGNDTVFGMIASEFGIRPGIPEEVKEEVKDVKTTLSKEEAEEGIRNGRVDLRGETITTIDGKDTKDIDDAISAILLPNGNYLIKVPIADVSYYVKMGSKTWAHAEHQGNSHYWGDKVDPMLPVEYSNGICSLNPNEDRFALTVEYELTPSGERVNPKIYPAVIKSKQKMNYDAVQDIIDNKYTEDTKDYTTLKYTVKKDDTIDSIAYMYAMKKEELLEVNEEKDIKEGNEINIPTRRVVLNNFIASRIIKSAFRARGKLDIESKERKYVIDENGKVLDIHRRIQRPAEELIEYMMLYANEAFADVMVDELSKIFIGQVPFVFRTHGDPDPKKISEFLDMLAVYGITISIKIDPYNVTSHDIAVLLESLKDKENYSAFNNKILRCLQKAKYTPNNYGHFGIGSKRYCHFTSPIRRMPDLTIHTMWREIVHEGKRDTETLKFWANYVNDMCEYFSQCEVDSEKCERAIEDRLNAQYMEDKEGKTFEATVEDMFVDGFFVMTNENLVEGKVEYYLENADAEEILSLEDPKEISEFVKEYKKLLSGTYEYNEKLFGYTRGKRVCLRFGDQVLVVCTGSHPEERKIDFTLVRKM
ncbi:MAG: RNB domain-containing ribonuclease [Bacilli bacterium]|nr:RNB domain-containing ribonuclease [Bacilli bacterium]